MRRREFLVLGCALALAPAGCLGREETEERAPSGEHGADPQRRESRSGAEDPDERDGNDASPEQEQPSEAAEHPDEEIDDGSEEVSEQDYPTSAEEWGERVTGVRTRLDTDERVMALTFDACGGTGGEGYDSALVEFLVAEGVPATLFFNQRWIEANEATFRELARHPLFEVANHGTEHRPLSVTGRSAWGIAGTAGPAEVIDEVRGAQRVIERLTGRSPRHFRSGTAHYDEVAVRIVRDLGLEAVNFDILGDAGATRSPDEVASALEAAQPGSIALLHMNQPSSGTARGVRDALPALRRRGFSFATLGAHDLV